MKEIGSQMSRLRQGYSESFREQAAGQAEIRRLTSGKTKRLAASVSSIRQALNC
jgi:hypothetical protein